MEVGISGTTTDVNIIINDNDFYNACYNQNPRVIINNNKLELEKCSFFSKLKDHLCCCCYSKKSENIKVIELYQLGLAQKYGKYIASIAPKQVQYDLDLLKSLGQSLHIDHIIKINAIAEEIKQNWPALEKAFKKNRPSISTEYANDNKLEDLNWMNFSALWTSVNLKKSFSDLINHKLN